MKNTINNAVKTALSLTILGFITLANTQQSPAQTTAITNIVGSSGIAPTQILTVGWEFSVSTPINVLSLGVLGKAGSFNTPHEVGIFRVSDGALLTSTVVTNASALDTLSSFRYQSVTSTLLSAGENYRIGALFTPGASAITDRYSIDCTSFVNAGAITYVGGRFLPSSVLSNPTSVDPDPLAKSYFSANFRFEPVSATTAPEPGTLALIAVGGVGLATRLRLRRRKLAQTVLSLCF
jgi:hypothetical protein